MNVTSIRISVEMQRAMEYVSRVEKIEKVQSLRKLAQVGFEYYLAQAYQAGKLSLREGAGYLNLTLSQTIDLFAEMGIKGGVRSHDVLASLDSIKD